GGTRAAMASLAEAQVMAASWLPSGRVAVRVRVWPTARVAEVLSRVIPDPAAPTGRTRETASTRASRKAGMEFGFRFMGSPLHGLRPAGGGGAGGRNIVCGLIIPYPGGGGRGFVTF